MRITDLKPLEKNPFKSKGDKQIELIAKSIKQFEKMMAIRPIVIDEKNNILGGNKRYFALKVLGYTEVPDKWITKQTDLTEKEKQEFIIKDNAHWGSDWDYELLKDWDIDLQDFGVDIDFELWAFEDDVGIQEKEEPRTPFGDKRDTLPLIKLLQMYEKVFVNFSGGKDSIAVACFLKKNNIDFELVCCQEIYQHPDLPEYVKYVADVLKVKINLLPGISETEQMKYLKLYGFPSRVNKWCNSKTKVEPLDKFYKTVNVKYIVCIGTRAEESARRAKMISRGKWGKNDFVFPIFDFKIDDVIKIIDEFNIKLHHCYTVTNRMGCFFCPEMSPVKIKNLMVNEPKLFSRALNYYRQGMECDKYRASFGLSQLDVIIKAFDAEYVDDGIVKKNKAWYPEKE